jgi:hypothetical protein
MHALRKATVAFVFVGFVAAHALALDPPPSAKQLRQWMGDECVAAGKHVGIDYARLLDRAIEEDSAGLVGLFRFTASAWFVGAAAENHCGILLGLLQRWGDERFARVLRRQKPRIRKAVVDAIDYSLPYPGWKPTQFPHTYSLVPHEHAPPDT